MRGRTPSGFCVLPPPAFRQSGFLCYCTPGVFATRLHIVAQIPTKMAQIPTKMAQIPTKIAQIPTNIAQTPTMMAQDRRTSVCVGITVKRGKFHIFTSELAVGDPTQPRTFTPHAPPPLSEFHAISHGVTLCTPPPQRPPKANNLIPRPCANPPSPPTHTDRRLGHHWISPSLGRRGVELQLEDVVDRPSQRMTPDPMVVASSPGRGIKECPRASEVPEHSPVFGEHSEQKGPTTICGAHGVMA